MLSKLINKSSWDTYYIISSLYRTDIFPQFRPGSYIIHHGHLEANLITYCNPNTLSRLTYFSPNSHIGIGT